MTDRMDIDALLIGALYGELTPVDEARLAAHLESHPADRTTLADLTRTRAQLRESRVLAVQLEPPQSVSALLLQEAARRAPRPQRDHESWFYRLARSLMAHPALATAAMLVVVVGVAGTLYIRHGDQLTQSTAPSFQPETTTASATRADEALAPAAPAAAAPAVAQEPTGVASKEEGTSSGANRGSGTYGVGLAETSLQQRAADRERQLEKARPTDGPQGIVVRDEVKQVASADAPDRFSAPPKPALATAEQKAQKKTAGIEVRSPEAAPKELDKNKAAGAKRGFGGAADGFDDLAADDRAQAPSPRPRTVAPAAPPPPPPPATQPAPPAADPIVALRTGPSKPLVGNVGNAGNAAPRDNAKDAKLDRNAPARKAAPGGGQAAPSAASGSAPRNGRQQADTASGFEDLKLAEEQDKANGALLGWARNKHDQIVALVKSSNCLAAASAAMEIYGRAPDYYASNVATDRSVKPCLAYLNRERQREDRVRAAKRANAVDAAPSQAAPPAPVKK